MRRRESALERRDQVRKISRSGGDDGVEIEACSPIRNLGSDVQPVKKSEYWSNVM